LSKFIEISIFEWCKIIFFGQKVKKLSKISKKSASDFAITLPSNKNGIIKLNWKSQVVILIFFSGVAQKN